MQTKLCVCAYAPLPCAVASVMLLVQQQQVGGAKRSQFLVLLEGCSAVWLEGVGHALTALIHWWCTFLCLSAKATLLSCKMGREVAHSPTEEQTGALNNFLSGFRYPQWSHSVMSRKVEAIQAVVVIDNGAGNCKAGWRSWGQVKAKCLPSCIDLGGAVSHAWLQV